MPYLKSIMGFMGIDTFEAVVLEGVDAIPERTDEFKGLAAEKARRIAASF